MRHSLMQYNMYYGNLGKEIWSIEKVENDYRDRALMFSNGALSCIQINDSEKELENFMKVQKEFAIEARRKEEKYIEYFPRENVYKDLDGNILTNEQITLRY